MQCVRPRYKTEVLAVIVVARLHSPATSNDQHSSHQTCSMAPAIARTEYVSQLRTSERSSIGCGKQQSRANMGQFPRHKQTVAWYRGNCRPNQEGVQSIEWHRRHVGLENGLISRRSFSSNSERNNKFSLMWNIAKCSLMKLQQAIAVLNVMIPHKHIRGFTSCTLQNLTDNPHW